MNTWSAHGRDHQRDYMNWYFNHLPKAPGVNADGRLNNWWRYLYDFANYRKDGQPRPPTALIVRIDDSPGAAAVAIAYRSAAGIDPGSCDSGDISLHFDKGEVIKPASVTISDPRPGGYRVATYRFSDLKAGRLSSGTLRLHPDQVKDFADATLKSAEWKLVETNGQLESQPAADSVRKN